MKFEYYESKSAIKVALIHGNEKGQWERTMRKDNEKGQWERTSSKNTSWIICMNWKYKFYLAKEWKHHNLSR